MRWRPTLRWRRNWKLPVALAAATGTLLVVGGSFRVIPYVSDLATLPQRETTTNIGGDVELFDDGMVHTIELEIEAEDNKRLLDAYRNEGEKIVVPAIITIDGVRIERVGIRLKGNSSLGMLGGGAGAADGAVIIGPDGAHGEGGRGGGPPDDLAKCMAEKGFDLAEPQGDGELVVAGAADVAQPAAPNATPYLVIFDEYVQGQRYQGINELALRAGGVGTSIAETLTAAAYSTAGLPVPRTAMAGLSINDEPEQLYNVTQNPDQTYVDLVFPNGDGALYKATAMQSQDFSYNGDDPSDYDGFDQVTGRKRFDKQHLIELIRFVAEASDKEFAEELPERFDVQELARMLALNNILQNWDSIGTGPGGNYYLYYDAVGGRIIPLAWDFNLSLGGSATAPPEPLAPGGMGGPAHGGDTVTIGADTAPAPGEVGSFEIDEKESAAFEDCMGGAGFDLPAGGQQDGDDMVADSGPLNNRLVERFVQTPEFRALYDEAMTELTEQVLTEGALVKRLDELKATLSAAIAARPTLATTTDTESAFETVKTFLVERGKYLESELD